MWSLSWIIQFFLSMMSPFINGVWLNPSLSMGGILRSHWPITTTSENREFDAQPKLHSLHWDWRILAMGGVGDLQRLSWVS